MAFCECAAGSGLQISLESELSLLRWKFDRHDNGPGSLRRRVAAGTFVVPAEAFIGIRCDSDVVPRGICVAAKDVHESSAGSFHVATIAQTYCQRPVGRSDCVQSGRRVFGLACGPPSLAWLACELRRDRLRLSLTRSLLISEKACLDEARSRSTRAKSGWEAGIRTPIPWSRERRMGCAMCRSTLFCSSFRRYCFSTLHSVLLCSRAKCLIVSQAPTSLSGLSRFGTNVDAICA